MKNYILHERYYRDDIMIKKKIRKKKNRKRRRDIRTRRKRKIRRKRRKKKTKEREIIQCILKIHLICVYAEKQFTASLIEYCPLKLQSQPPSSNPGSDGRVLLAQG